MTTEAALGGARRLRDLWRLDAVSSATPLRARPLQQRRRRIAWLRHAFQIFTALVTLGIGYEFVRWVRALEAGHAAGARPAGVEGFLPIAALMSLRHLWMTGEVHGVHPAGLVILLAVLGASLVLKKAFCSWLCPIGTLSEALAAIAGKAFGGRVALPRLFDVPLRGLKYLLLAFFMHAIFVSMRASDLAAFLDSPYHRVADIKMLYFFERLSPFALKVLAGLAAFSLLLPYFWCRYLCPYGALLGAASLLSPLKVTRHAPSCIDCGLCAAACPSNLPVDRLARVRSDECSGCLSCVAACPVNRALRVETPGPWRAQVRPAPFALLLLLVFGGTIAVGRAVGLWGNAITNEEYAARIREIDDPRYGHAGGRPALGEADPRSLARKESIHAATDR